MHLLRDLRELGENYAVKEEVQAWVGQVLSLYREGKAAEAIADGEEREAKARELEKRSRGLGLRYARLKSHPCCALAKRLLRHEAE